MTTDAPEISGRYRSRPAMSKATVATARSRSEGFGAIESFIAARKLTRLPVEITTPLGRPVDPEV